MTLQKYRLSTSVLVALLLTSFNASACSIHFTVVNHSGYNFSQLAMSGPSRISEFHDLADGHSFKYHAEGSFITCHGVYHLTIAGPQSYARPDAKPHTYRKDTHVTATITNHCKSTGPESLKSCSVTWTPTHS